MSILKKRQAICLALFLCLPALANAMCFADGEVQSAKIKRVVDGDTVHLMDGRKIRLIGINTPELDHQHGNHEAFAVAARQRLMALVPDNVVYWQAAQEDEDHYGRKLYYLFTKDRASISGKLLSDGLGYRIAIPPNLKYQDCFDQAEREAQTAQRGVWQNPPSWQPKAGFTVARPIITSVTHNRGGWWLETDWDLVINLPPYAEYLWSEKDVYFLQGQTVEVRGWQYQRKKRQNDRFKSTVLTVKHPLDLRRIDASQRRH